MVTEAVSKDQGGPFIYRYVSGGGDRSGREGWVLDEVGGES